MEYVEALNNLLSLDSKKYNSKKWWSRGVVELLLQMHLEHTFEFGAGQQTAGWLSEKASMHKTKFEMDQKNRLDDLVKKRKAEEDERRDAARFCQTVSAASEQLVEAFKVSPHLLLRLKMWEQWSRKNGNDEDADYG